MIARPLAALIAAAVLAIVLAGTALAQGGGVQSVDYAAWDRIASQAETLLDDPDANSARLTDMRERLSEWRARLLEAESANGERVDRLRAQIEALGPVPNADAGESEPAAIAQRRAELNAQLAAAQEPGITALEAYNRADGLIAEIDEVLRTRQTEALLEAVPSPVNPANWPPALETAYGVASTVAGEVRDTFASEERRREMLQHSPVTLALAVAALLLLARGRHWTTRLTDYVQGRRRQHGVLMGGFLISLSQVLVPLGGISLLLAAVASVGFAGEVGSALLRSLFPVAVIVYGALWLAGRVFTADPAMPTLFNLDMGLRRGLRRTTILIGALLGIASVIKGVSGLDQVPVSHAAIYNLPVVLGLCYGYWRLSRLLRKAVKQAAGDEAPAFSLWVVGILGRVAGVIALAAPLAAIAGYNNLSMAVVIPTGATLWLIGLFVALQWPIRDLYATLTRTEIEKAGEALIPVLVNFVLLIAAMPLLALIWGTRPEQLGELYARFSEGVTLGETRLTPGVVLRVVVVFGLCYMLTRFVQGALKTTVLPRTRLDAGSRNAVTSFVGYTGIALAALLAINAGGIDLTALAYVFGALSVGIGFGLQNVVQNFVAGIILLIERPIGEGDWIEVGGQMGIVKSISVRSTTIETFDKQEVIVPNADFIAGTVTNWTRGSEIGRAIVEVGVAYGTDTRKVQQILLEIAKEHPVVAQFPAPGVDFMNFGASSLDFRVRMILRDVNRIMEVQTEVRHRIAERFAEEGIEIPFAQQDVWIRNPETLRPGGAQAPRGPSDEGDPQEPEPREAEGEGGGGDR